MVVLPDSGPGPPRRGLLSVLATASAGRLGGQRLPRRKVACAEPELTASAATLLDEVYAFLRAAWWRARSWSWSWAAAAVST